MTKALHDARRKAVVDVILAELIAYMASGKIPKRTRIAAHDLDTYCGAIDWLARGVRWYEELWKIMNSDKTIPRRKTMEFARDVINQIFREQEQAMGTLKSSVAELKRRLETGAAGNLSDKELEQVHAIAHELVNDREPPADAPADLVAFAEELVATVDAMEGSMTLAEEDSTDAEREEAEVERLAQRRTWFSPEDAA